MMYYYVPYGENATAAFHNTWQNELNSLGLPQGDAGKPIENLSIVNGGSDNSDAGMDYHNYPVLDLRFNIANGNHPHCNHKSAGADPQPCEGDRPRSQSGRSHSRIIYAGL